MKKITTFLFLMLFFISNSVNSQNYKYLGEYTSNGTPLYLESERDVVSTQTLEMISNSIPEQYPVPDYNPQYITAGYDTDLKITSNTDVYVTFIDEGAGYRNVLGFYTYDLNDPNPQKPNREDLTIIFPNASLLGSGGGLRVGDKVNIGNFEAGTGIGWVLLANAWSSSQQKVGWGLWDLYSNDDYNPESNPSERQHIVTLNDPSSERIIIGFEDIRRDRGGCDHDFNDAIFYVTASSYEAIDTNNFADVSDATNVTSAYDGGLESNGDLASLIAKRNFKRFKSGNANNKKENQLKFAKSDLQSKGTTTLINYLPETGMYATETATVSSPNDLIGITNATEVFSVDYYEGNTRVSAVLATKTEGKVYDHSKMICDRLNNSSLEDVRTVVSRGHQIIASKIKRASGEIEFTLSFSIKTDNNTNELFSFWNIDQYPEGNYHNFQIWGSSYGQVFSIANHIIDTHTNQNGLISNKVQDVLPPVFVKSGVYRNGVIELNIVNKANQKAIDFNASIAKTELSDHEDFYSNISLSGAYNETIKIETGVLFDLGFSLKTEVSEQIDALYLADGPWGLDYLDDKATINEFSIDYENRDYVDNIFEVDRNVFTQGEVNGNVNLFRHILPGDQTLDATTFKFMNFDLTSDNAIELVVVQNDNRTWENRLRMQIPPSNGENVSVELSDFKDANGNTVNITNIKTIVFSVRGDYTSFKTFSLDVKNVTFSKTSSVLSTDVFNIEENNKLMNYPNPFSERTTIVLPEDSDLSVIKVIDLLGRVVDYKDLGRTSNKKLQYSHPNLNKGMYKYILLDDKKNIHKGTFLIN